MASVEPSTDLSAQTNPTKTQAETYLQSLLGKTLRITTTDKRMFLGQFKCTDSDLNIILSQTHEYTPPPAPSKADLERAAIEGKQGLKLDMTSRFLGLVVVPGEHIVKIEVEEFVSQMKGKGMAAAVV